MRIDAAPWEAVQILDKMGYSDIESISDVYKSLDPHGFQIPSSLVQARLEKYGEGMKIFQYKRPRTGTVQRGALTKWAEVEESYFFFATSEEDFLTKLFVYEIHDV